MNQYFKKLVTRFFSETLGDEALSLDYLDGVTSERVYRYPFLLEGRLQVRIDETNLRSRMVRRTSKNGQAVLILRSPQELLKKDVRDWIEQVLERTLDLERPPPSLIRKIKRYRSGYKRLNQGRRIRRAERRSKDAQKRERKFLEMREKMRKQNNHKALEK